MRVWKNKRGVIAYLVFAVGLVVQNGPILWAKTEGSGAETDETPILRPMVDGKPGLAMPSGVVEKDLVPPPLDAPPDLPKPPMYNGENGPPNMPPKSDGNKMQPFNSEQMPSPAPPGNMGGVHRRVHGDRPAFGAPKQNAPGMRETRNTKPKTPNPNEADILNVVPQKCVQAKGHFTWNFEEEELISVLRQVSDLLCKTIVVNDSVGKNMKLTIIGKSELSPKDAWDILVASLSAKGLILVQQGKTWTVIKRPELKSYSTPMYSNGKQAQNNEEIGTLFYKVQHTSQDVLRNVAQKLISKDGLVDSVGDQFIIVIDSNSNIRRLGAIFAQVDIKDASSKIQVLEPLLNADVKTVERQLREIFDVAPAGQRARPRRGVPNEPRSALEIEKIIADERTHRLIVVGDKEPVDRLKEAVALLDIAVPDQATKGKIHVRKISHGDAKKIAETLTAVVQQGKSPNRFGRRRDEGTNELFEGEVKITAHENTNMLVTVANANDYRSLLATINQLDVKKPQVYVEAAILDIQVTDNNKFGIDLFSGLNANIPGVGGSLGLVANPGGRGMADTLKSSVATTSTANLGALGQNSLGALAVLGNFLQGGVAGLVGPKIQGTEIPSFGAVLQAVSANSNVDVLSTPYLLTTDNQQAEMAVGEKVPVVRGASTVGGSIGGGLSIPIQNVSYEDVKLTFKITPHVGADNNVRLEVEQAVDELGPKVTILNQEQYRIRTKSAKTTLVLKDQQTGVIGGLIHHRSQTHDDKIPFLGDVPILGWLFKKRATEKDARSLALVLTVYIIKNEDDYRKIVERKLKEREEFARLYYGGKIKNYNPHIDYDKKTGPMSSLLLAVDQEMNKTENGGPGEGGDVVITPKEQKKSEGESPNSETVVPPEAPGGSASLEEGSFSEEFPREDFPISTFSEPAIRSMPHEPLGESARSGG